MSEPPFEMHSRFESVHLCIPLRMGTSTGPHTRVRIQSRLHSLSPLTVQMTWRPPAFFPKRSSDAIPSHSMFSSCMGAVRYVSGIANTDQRRKSKQTLFNATLKRLPLNSTALAQYYEA